MQEPPRRQTPFSRQHVAAKHKRCCGSGALSTCAFAFAFLFPAKQKAPAIPIPSPVVRNSITRPRRQGSAALSAARRYPLKSEQTQGPTHASAVKAQIRLTSAAGHGVVRAWDAASSQRSSSVQVQEEQISCVGLAQSSASGWALTGVSEVELCWLLVPRGRSAIPGSLLSSLHHKRRVPEEALASEGTGGQGTGGREKANCRGCRRCKRRGEGGKPAELMEEDVGAAGALVLPCSTEPADLLGL